MRGLVSAAQRMLQHGETTFAAHLPDHRHPGLHIRQAGDGVTQLAVIDPGKEVRRRLSDKAGEQDERVGGECMVVAKLRKSACSGARYLRLIEQCAKGVDGLQTGDGGRAHAGVRIGSGRLFKDCLFRILEREQRFAPRCRIRVRRLRLAFEKSRQHG